MVPGAMAGGAPMGMMSPEHHMASTGSKAATGSALAMIIGTLMSWMNVTFFSAASLSGVRVWEGRLTLIVGVIALILGMGAVMTRGAQRVPMLIGAAVCGIIGFIACLIFAFRFGHALTIPPVLGGSEARSLANAGAGLDAGWYLSIASSIALIVFALWGAMTGKKAMEAHQSQQAVSGMEWVDPNEPGGHGTHARGGRP